MKHTSQFEGTGAAGDSWWQRRTGTKGLTWKNKSNTEMFPSSFVPEMASSIFLRAPKVVMPSSFRSWSVRVRNVWRSIWKQQQVHFTRLKPTRKTLLNQHSDEMYYSKHVPSHFLQFLPTFTLLHTEYNVGIYFKKTPHLNRVYSHSYSELTGWCLTGTLYQVQNLS